MTLREAVEAGDTIHYAPVSGGIMVMIGGRQNTDCRFTIQDFIDLRNDGTITLFDTMRQGHEVFHGLVNIYRKKP